MEMKDLVLWPETMEKSEETEFSLFGQRFKKLHCHVFPLWTVIFVDIREHKRHLLYIRQRHNRGNSKHVLRMHNPWFPSAPIRPHNGKRPFGHTHLEVSVTLMSSDSNLREREREIEN